MKIRFNRTDITLWTVGILLMILLNTDLRKKEINWSWALAVIASAYLISQIQGYVIPRLMRQAGEWSVQKTIGMYALVTMVVAVTMACSVMFLVSFFKNEQLSARAYIMSSMMYVIMTFAFTSVYMIQIMTERWKKSLLQEERLNQALLKAEYDSLKNQVNPHFLFNSLNILSALIPEDPHNAVNLVERLSKVFRYNLQNNDRVTVELATELKIVEAYLFIHKMRFGDNLHYEINVEPEELPRQIVTQGLLTLVENAIKHNECSSEKPLRIALFSENDCVVVSNSFQPKNKQFLESTGIGLKNLKSRYALVTPQKVEVQENEAFFEVRIPFV